MRVKEDIGGLILRRLNPARETLAVRWNEYGISLDRGKTWLCISLSFSLTLKQLALYPMNTPETFRQEYQSPSLRIVPINVENAVCDSSIPGGNEDIGYEDWD